MVLAKSFDTEGQRGLHEDTYFSEPPTPSQNHTACDRSSETHWTSRINKKNSRSETSTMTTKVIEKTS